MGTTRLGVVGIAAAVFSLGCFFLDVPVTRLGASVDLC